MRAIIPASQQFRADQQLAHVVNYWDTPFTPLQTDTASAGVPFEMREPTSTGAYDVLAAVRDTVSPSGVAAAWTASTSKLVVSNGRVANLVAYWAGGAPGHHGASVSRRVAYKFSLTLRSTTGRAWFNVASTITPVTIAFAGSGYVRIIKNGSTAVFAGPVTESEFLARGFSYATISGGLTTGDVLDIYYVQDQDPWGGYVFKLIDATLPTKLNDRMAAVADAPVLGCGLMDTGTPPTMRTLQMLRDIQVTQQQGQTARAEFSVPLMGDNNDGIGWEWVRTNNDSGFLRAHNPDGSTFDVMRQRMLRIKLGYQDFQGVPELYPSFCGMIDDFEGPSSGVVRVSALGMEQRLVDQFVKNYPDMVSYMTYGYRRLSGAGGPVFGISAYDNWPLQYAIRDMLVRCGIDESRTRVPVAVPQSDGTTLSVTM